VEIADQGPGFPDDYLPHAFERFSRPDPSHHPSRHWDLGGPGLGLALCRVIVAAHHGSISATNDPNGGARIRIRLPASRSRQEDGWSNSQTSGDLEPLTSSP
jgi:signal transduction histidine kinase